MKLSIMSANRIYSLVSPVFSTHSPTLNVKRSHNMLAHVNTAVEVTDSCPSCQGLSHRPLQAASGTRATSVSVMTLPLGIKERSSKSMG
jgi:hypothetical protein